MPNAMCDRPTSDPLARQNPFDGDAMLMYGWWADRDLRVRWLNRSLVTQLAKMRMESLADRVNGAGVPITEFLDELFDPNSFEDVCPGESLGTAIVESLRKLTVFAESFHENPNATLQEASRFYDCHLIPMSRRAPGGGCPLLGVRAVKAAGFKLKSEDPRDRVDLVVVCQIVKEGERYRVASFQGQLQDAWLRLEFAIREGTKSGTVALMGRNMSHNIGSHVLFGLEHEGTLLALQHGGKCESDPDLVCKQPQFHKYLRERMELMAGFATGVALPATSERLNEMVEGFADQKIISDHLGRSEAVTKIEVSFADDGEHTFRVAVPGGIVGVQAFYSLLENIARDSAKNGRRDGTVGLAVRAKLELSLSKTEYLRVTVADDQETYHEAEKKIRPALDRLQIVDEAGRFKREDWGTKERLIAAAYLRGLRLEDDVCLRQVDGHGYPKMSIGNAAPDGLKLLDIESHDGNLAWIFYLPVAKDVLVIDDCAQVLNRTDESSLSVHDHAWLSETMHQPSSIRHRFTVIRPRTASEREWLAEYSTALPISTYLMEEESVQLPESLGGFMRLRPDLGTPPNMVTKSTLYRAWIDHLLARRAGNPPVVPTLVVQEPWKRFEFRPETGGFVGMECGWSFLEQPRDSTLPIVFLDGHGGNDWVASEIVHYERHYGGDAIRSFHEELVGEATDATRVSEMCFEAIGAALTRILVVDERLHTRVRRESYKKRTYEEICAWKGIGVRGSEFSHTGFSLELLLDWVRSPQNLKLPERANPTTFASGFDVLSLHRGVADKLENECGIGLEDLCGQLARHVPFVVLHSGRMDVADFPTTCRFLPLSNVTEWVIGGRNKIAAVRELLQLRRPQHERSLYRREQGISG